MKTERLKVKGWKEYIISIGQTQECYRGYVDTVFKTVVPEIKKKSIFHNEKWVIDQEDIIAINSMHLKRALEYVKQKLIAFKKKKQTILQS